MMIVQPYPLGVTLHLHNDDQQSGKLVWWTFIDESIPPLNIAHFKCFDHPESHKNLLNGTITWTQPTWRIRTFSDLFHLLVQLVLLVIPARCQGID